MDCRSVSEADWVCDWGEGVQCPKERKPIFFMQVKFTVWFGLGLAQYVRTYYSVAMGKPSLREELLDAGFKVMFRSGYTAASVRDICEAAQVPLGSFTNHFRSKEAFAQEVLDRYFAGTKSVVKEALEDKSLTPRQRLMRYLDLISGRIADRKWNLGCMIGDFSLETSTQSKPLRRRLEAIFKEWRAPFVSCIAEGQAMGEIDSQFDPIDLAEFLLSSWEGAILRMKVERTPAALERFKKIAFQTIFKELK
jgi:TetR/AcrR family transcriptional repressor of nem operon